MTKPSHPTGPHKHVSLKDVLEQMLPEELKRGDALAKSGDNHCTPMSCSIVSCAIMCNGMSCGDFEYSCGKNGWFPGCLGMLRCSGFSGPTTGCGTFEVVAK